MVRNDSDGDDRDHKAQDNLSQCFTTTNSIFFFLCLYRTTNLCYLLLLLMIVWDVLWLIVACFKC